MGKLRDVLPEGSKSSRPYWLHIEENQDLPLALRKTEKVGTNRRLISLTIHASLWWHSLCQQSFLQKLLRGAGGGSDSSILLDWKLILWIGWRHKPKPEPTVVGAHHPQVLSRILMWFSLKRGPVDFFLEAIKKWFGWGQDTQLCAPHLLELLAGVELSWSGSGWQHWTPPPPRVTSVRSTHGSSTLSLWKMLTHTLTHYLTLPGSDASGTVEWILMVFLNNYENQLKYGF